MFIRRSALEQAGGLFDEDYLMFNEDIDFCWRTKLVGYKTCVVPSSKAYHARGGTVEGVLIKTNPTFQYTTTRNRLVTLFKNYEMANVLRYVPLTITFETVKSIWLIANGRHRSGLASLRGVFSFVRRIRTTCVKRYAVQSRRTRRDDEVKSQMLPLSEAVRASSTYAMEISRMWRATPHNVV